MAGFHGDNRLGGVDPMQSPPAHQGRYISAQHLPSRTVCESIKQALVECCRQHCEADIRWVRLATSAIN